MSCIRKLAMLEPLVDTVNNDNVCTDHCEMMVSPFSFSFPSVLRSLYLLSSFSFPLFSSFSFLLCSMDVSKRD